MAACTLIEYEFDGLALLSDGKFGGMFVNGIATIAAYDHDEWHVRDLKIDGIEIEKDALPWLWHRIVACLEEEKNDSILEAVRMEDEGIAQRMRSWAA